MENPATFDLNQAIQQWCQELAASPAIGQDDLDELESHMRDAVAAMELKGLSPAEAFWIARYRLGNGDSLQSEFGKVNTNQIWIDRALWMIAGSIGIGTISSITYSLWNLATLGMYQLDFLGQQIGPARTLLYPIILSCVLWGVWSSRNPIRGTFSRLENWFRAHPVLTVVAVVLLHGAEAIASNGTQLLMVRAMSPASFGELMGWQTIWILYVPQILLFPMLLGWLLAKARRTTRQVTQL